MPDPVEVEHEAVVQGQVGLVGCVVWCFSGGLRKRGVEELELFF